MIYPVCAIRDAKVSFFPPQTYETIPAAIREFSMAVNSASGRGAISFAPADFDMYHIANFDSEKGTIEAVSPIIQIVSGYSVAVVGEKYEE